MVARRATARLVYTSAMAFIQHVEEVEDHPPHEYEVSTPKTFCRRSICVNRLQDGRREGKSWPTNSLGNHTVNLLHSFGVVFVDFDKEYLKNQDFRQNISNPARCSAFFMYTLFFLENRSSWRNIGFTVPKWRRKHDNTSVLCLDWAFPSDYPTFRRHFRQ